MRRGAITVFPTRSLTPALNRAVVEQRASMEFGDGDTLDASEIGYCNGHLRVSVLLADSVAQSARPLDTPTPDLAGREKRTRVEIPGRDLGCASAESLDTNRLRCRSVDGGVRIAKLAVGVPTPAVDVAASQNGARRIGTG